MSGGALRLRPGAMVVLEGLDRSGKSTQRERLSTLPWGAPAPVFTHMPSGLTDLTADIYRLTEHAEIRSAWARQLLHLACHAENIPALVEARGRGGLVLDRWWWSTVAYGWYAGRVGGGGISKAVFQGVIDSVWGGQRADIVFLFMTPFEHDDLNRETVARGYADLAAEYATGTVTVPRADMDATTAFLLATLRDRDLISG